MLNLEQLNTRGTLRPHTLRILAAHWNRFLRFSVVGASGTVVNTMALWFLVAVGGWSHMAAAALATEVAILFNFTLNDRWTFHGAEAAASRLRRACQYNLLALAGFVISLLVLAVLTIELGTHYLVANLMGIGASTMWTYVTNSWLTWRVPGGGKLAPVAQAGNAG